MSARIIIVPTGKTGPSGGAGSTALDDLTDVTITTPSNGQVLKYNGSAWVNGTDATGGGGGALDDLTDVTITAAASGDILRHNGTAWVDAVGTTHFEAAGGISTHAAVTSGVHGISAFGATLVDDADASAARTTLGLVIGTNVQAQDAELAAIAGLTSAADRLPYFTGSGTAALATFTAAGRNLLDDADAAAQRTTLGIVAASDTASGIVELATTAETTTGTDTGRAVTPAGLLNATTASNINARIGVEKAGTLIGTRRRINFIDGANVTVTVADDAGNEEVDVTIAASGGGGSGLLQNVAGMSGTDYWGLPGWFVVPSGSSVSFTGLASTAFYFPITVTDTITVTDVQVWVTVAGTAGGTNRLSIYTADSSWQPTATSGLVLDMGTVAIDSTGNKTITGLSQSLSPGRYLLRIHSDASASQPSYHFNQGGLIGGTNLSNHAALAASVYWRRALTYAVAEANPLPWNAASSLTASATATSGFLRTPFQMRWT